MFIYGITDFLIVILSWAIAYFIRFHALPDNTSSIDYEILFMGLFVGLITLVFFFHNDLYTSQRYFSWYKEMFSVFKSHFQAISSIVVLLYFLNPSRLSRIMLMIYSFLVVITSLSGRLLMKSILSERRRKGKNLKHIMLMGSNEPIREYARKIIETPELGLRIIGWLDSRGKSEKLNINEIKSIDHIPTGKDKGSPDALILGYEMKDYPQQNDRLAYFNKTVIPVWILPAIEHTFIGYTIESFHGLPMIKINGNRLTMVEKLAKRSMDVIGSFLALILLSPLMLLIGIITKLSSRGPVFYGQERISQDGQSFTMWKYRSMRIDAEKESGAVWTSKNDSRITPLGAFLRKTSLDELPQLWNIIKGEMSLVGPRPERPVFIERFKEEIPSYMLRHKMKAGLTGWAQVNGWRGNTSLEKRIEFDLYYIQNWTIWLDIRIIFLTFLKGFVNPNAY